MTNLSGAQLNSGAADGPQGDGRDSPSRFPEYPAYKDSGVEWLGEVPEHWSVLPVKWVGWLKGGAGFPHDKQGVDSYELDFHKVNALASADSDGVLRTSENTITRETAKELGAYIFPKGTIVFAKVGAALLLGRLRTISAEACLDNNMMGLIVFPGRASNQYALYSMGTVRFDLIANPGAVPSLNEGQIGNYRLAFPGLPEQTQIARFLDHETARIDALIEEQQRLIELLKEKRQAVISHAVTKGLDSTVPMKDSGEVWLGKLPAHWVKKRLKNISPSITVGIVVNPSGYVADEGLPFLYGGEVKEGFIEVDKARKISPGDSKKNRKTVLETGDIVTMRVGYPGLTAVVPPECEGGNCASVMLVKRGKYDSHWLCAVMNSRLVRQQVELVQYGAAQKQFNISDAIEFWMFEPPRAEQTIIAEFIDRQSSVFNALMEESERSMQLLQERRSALISAAVTGKIDVRGWQPPVGAQTHELVQKAG
jgi:type I restriction enzyme S subunit